MTLESDDTLIDVFYPARGDAEGPTLRYAVIEPLSDALQALMPPDLDTPIEVDAVVDAPPSDRGPFPLVLHSHGSGANRRISAMHLAHLASWGLVAAAPDHPELGLTAAAGGVTGAPDPEADVVTLAATLDLLTRATIRRGNDLEGVIDTEQVGVEGHGAGGNAALEFGTDPQVDVVVGHAPSPPLLFDSGDQQADTARRVTEGEPPDKPVLLIAADGDATIDRVDDIEPLFARLTGEKTLAILDDTGHSVFLDTCQTIWERGGILDLIPDGVEELGRPLDETLLGLGDGCDPEVDVEPRELRPVIDHLTVARMLSVLGPDRASARLSLRSEFLAETFGERIADFRGE